MPSPVRTLDRAQLRDHLRRHEFASSPGGGERYGVEVELFPLRWVDAGPLPRVVPLRPRTVGEVASADLVAQFAAASGIGVVTPEGAVQPGQPGVGRFTFEPGGQIEYSSAPHESPERAYAEAVAVLDALAANFATQGVDVVTLGCNPWNGVDEIGLQLSAPRYTCMDAVFASIGDAGRRMMRQTATIHVNVDAGSPVRAALRWQAAQVLAPLALATFASSPLLEGLGTRHRSYRGAIWDQVDPSRCGFPRAFLDDPEGDPLEQYLEFALQARVLLVRDPRGWIPMTTPVTFDEWMRAGYGGLFPDLEDWAYHLTTLFPEVRPKGFLELRSADSQPRAFWSVPLTWWTALLGDDTALSRVLDRLMPTAGSLRQRWRRAAQEGLSDPELAGDAKFLFGVAADGIGALSTGALSPEMKRAFVVFAERFALRGRSPADEVLETFLERGNLDRAAWRGLHDAWAAEVGLGAPTA